MTRMTRDQARLVLKYLKTATYGEHYLCGVLRDLFNDVSTEVVKRYVDDIYRFGRDNNMCKDVGESMWTTRVFMPFTEAMYEKHSSAVNPARSKRIELMTAYINYHWPRGEKKKKVDPNVLPLDKIKAAIRMLPEEWFICHAIQRYEGVGLENSRIDTDPQLQHLERFGLAVGLLTERCSCGFIFAMEKEPCYLRLSGYLRREARTEYRIDLLQKYAAEYHNVIL